MKTWQQHEMTVNYVEAELSAEPKHGSKVGFTFDVGRYLEVRGEALN
jgi:hypothetical protein